MILKTFFYGLFLTIFGVKSLLASNIQILPPPSPEMTKEMFLETIQRPHADLSEEIEPLMCRLRNRDILDVFETLSDYFEKNQKQGHVYAQEIRALQPWSTLASHVWEKNLVFAQCYSPILKAKKGLQNDIKTMDPEKRITFWITSLLPVSSKINFEFYNYEAYCRISILFCDLTDKIASGSPRNPELTPELVFKFAVVSNNIPIVLELINQYQGRREILKNFLKESLGYGHTRAVLTILDKDPGLVGERDKDGETILHESILSNHIQTTRELLKKYPDLLPIKNKHGGTAAHYACCLENAEIALAIPGSSLIFLEQDHQGYTPIQCACRNNCTNTLLALLERRPDLVLGKDPHGASVLHYCYEKAALLLLEKYPALLSMRDHEGATAGHYACMRDDATLILALVEQYPAFLTMADHDGATILHYACQNGCTKTALELVKKHRDLYSVPDDYGVSALDYGHRKGHHATIDAVREYMKKS
jgi:ankyrin repeat protein